MVQLNNNECIVYLDFLEKQETGIYLSLIHI